MAHTLYISKYIFFQNLPFRADFFPVLFAGDFCMHKLEFWPFFQFQPPKADEPRQRKPVSVRCFLPFCLCFAECLVIMTCESLKTSRHIYLVMVEPHRLATPLFTSISLSLLHWRVLCVAKHVLVISKCVVHTCMHTHLLQYLAVVSTCTGKNTGVPKKERR